MIYVDAIYDSGITADLVYDGGFVVDLIYDSPGSLTSSNVIDVTKTLRANTDETITNPFTLPVIPRQFQIKTSDGTFILDGYRNINQSTGNITINMGALFTNAIISIIGW